MLDFQKLEPIGLPQVITSERLLSQQEAGRTHKAKVSGSKTWRGWGTGGLAILSLYSPHRRPQRQRELLSHSELELSKAIHSLLGLLPTGDYSCLSDEL